MSRSRPAASWPRPAEPAVRAVVVLALGVDAVVHLVLAPGYQLAAPGGVGAGTLFRLQAAAALVAALYLLVRPGRGAYALAGLVALSALVPVLLYRYVDVPAFGPVPAMYEPVWFLEKALSAVAEAVAVVLAAVGVWLCSRVGKSERPAVPGRDRPTEGR